MGGDSFVILLCLSAHKKRKKHDTPPREGGFVHPSRGSVRWARYNWH